MREIIAEHLVVGSGLLGLALADHLLRRGARSVAVLEPSSHAPTHQAAGTPGLVLGTGTPAYAPLEQRGFLLLEEWPTYLGADPEYQRSGSWCLPDVAGNPGNLATEQVSARTSRLQLGPEQTASFRPEDGVLHLLALVSTLYQQVRDREGRVHFDSEIRHLEMADGSFRFEAGSRRGQAERVYLTGGVESVRLLSALNISSTYRVETWHSFQFDTPESESILARFAGEPESIFYDDGEGEAVLRCRGQGPFQREAPVAWDLLERFRTQHAQRLPGFDRATVKRGVAEHRLSLDPIAPGIVGGMGGRVLAAGAFGASEIPLALSVAEAMAETALGLEPTVSSADGDHPGDVESPPDLQG